MEPGNEAKAYCALQAFNGVLIAIVRSHSNPQSLAHELRRSAEEVETHLLDTQNSDQIIEDIRKQILVFARLAEVQGRR
jgi:hypothetical protein